MADSAHLDISRSSGVMPNAPIPTVMPVDREAWFGELHLSNFVNSYYQFRDVQSLPNCRRVLIVGPGQGLVPEVLKWRGYQVTTFDIDETFNPDVVGSVHDLSAFRAGQFDAVIASHVLEHLAVSYLDSALSEVARVAHYAILYLPVRGRHIHLRFIGIKNIDLSLIFDLFNPFEKPDGITPRYMEKQHFWEIGMPGFRTREMVQRFSNKFHVRSVYRNRDWLPSMNFILQSKCISE
jgi:SAM-dependent methyltransferase